MIGLKTGRAAAALSQRNGIGYKLQEISCLLLEYIYNKRDKENAV
jgi:hypothetical protein